MTRCYPVPGHPNGTRGFGLGGLRVEVVKDEETDKWIEDYLSKQPKPKTRIPTDEMSHWFPSGSSLVYLQKPRKGRTR